MKKLFAFIIVVTLALSPTSSAFAGGTGGPSDSSKGKTVKTERLENGQSDIQKTFKEELNAQKKLVVQNKGALEEQKVTLETQYEALLATGNTAEAVTIMLAINDLNTQIGVLQSQMKQVINERYMVIKSDYSDAELSQFENAAALIEQMYADVNVLDLGSITVKDNIIKLDAPAYIKGGRTIIPVRAITEELGATVIWNNETKSATISKDGIDIVLTMNSTEVIVNGVVQQIDVPAEVTNGRTYVPLRFIAETFGLLANWDAENNIIDIVEEESEEVQTTTEEAINVL